MIFDKDFLVEQLRELDRELGPDKHAEIVVRRDDDFDWSSLERCASCTLPGHQHGQDRDVRFETNSTDGLHGRFHSDRIAFHLDLADACRDLAGHGVKDTRMLPGAAIGALIGAFLGGGRGAALGAMAGGVLGAQVPSRAARVVEFRVLVANHLRQLGHAT